VRKNEYMLKTAKVTATPIESHGIMQTLRQ